MFNMAPRARRSPHPTVHRRRDLAMGSLKPQTPNPINPKPQTPNPKTLNPINSKPLNPLNPPKPLSP